MMPHKGRAQHTKKGLKEEKKKKSEKISHTTFVFRSRPAFFFPSRCVGGHRAEKNKNAKRGDTNNFHSTVRSLLLAFLCIILIKGWVDERRRWRGGGGEYVQRATRFRPRKMREFFPPLCPPPDTKGGFGKINVK